MFWNRNSDFVTSRMAVAVFASIALSACAHTEDATETSVAPPEIEPETTVAIVAPAVEATADAAPTATESEASIVVVQSSGDIRTEYPVGRKLRATDSVTLVEGDNLVILDGRGTRVLSGPGTFTIGTRATNRVSAAIGRRSGARVRTGAVRGSSSSNFSTAPQVIYRVSSASASAAERYPRGTRVYPGQNLCLRDNEQMTVSGTNGRRVTYTGPGCLKRAPTGSNENSGGFTFGWTDPNTHPLSNGAMAGD